MRINNFKARTEAKGCVVGFLDCVVWGGGSGIVLFR